MDEVEDKENVVVALCGSKTTPVDVLKENKKV